MTPAALLPLASRTADDVDDLDDLEEADRDDVVFRGDPASREFIAFWLSEGRVLAGMNVNVWDVAPAIERIVASEHVVDRARLADPDQPLEQLAAVA